MLTYRAPTFDDVQIYFEWANDPEVREQSFKSKNIPFAKHKKWFKEKLMDKTCFMLIFQNGKNEHIGQIRIQEQDTKNAIIGISIASKFRGKGLAKEMLNKACQFFFKKKSDINIHAYIKKENLGSKHAFEKADFKLLEITNFEEYESFHYIKKYENS